MTRATRPAERIIHHYSDGRIHFLQLSLGGDRNFCYLAGDRATGDAAAIDPGFHPEVLSSTAADLGLGIRSILLTHGHSDHAGAATNLARRTGACIFAGAEERVKGAHVLADGESSAVGDIQIRVCGTPGHSPGHLCFLFEDRLITGDLLFCGKVGGTGPDFPGSSARSEWESLMQIAQLPDSILVFPGHDYYGGPGRMTQSTIGFEKRHNPFLRCGDFEQFLHLKENWAAYKAKHGIR